MKKFNRIFRLITICSPLLLAHGISHAELLASTTYTFGGSATVTDLQGNGATNKTGTVLDTNSITKFNANSGVLTDVILNVQSSRKETAQVSVSDGLDTGSVGNVTASGSGGSTVRISAPGVNVAVSPSPFDPLTATCTGSRTAGCVGVPVVRESPNNVEGLNPANMNAYVGTADDVMVSYTASLLSATQAGNSFTGDESTTYTLDWSGNLTVSYRYLLHAMGSFNGDSVQQALTLDFGSVFQNATDPTLDFSIFNLAAANRAGLDLDFITPVSGDTGKLTTDFYSMLNVGQGSFTPFTAMLDTAEVGEFSARYRIRLSDADVGATSTLRNSTLNLFLKGTVVERPAEVPEPTTVALLCFGLLSLAASRRKSKKYKNT